jgi:hypothetical protein
MLSRITLLANVGSRKTGSDNPMSDLFDELVAGGETAFNKLIIERRQENIEIEFKTKVNATNGEVTKDDRRILGIALSALSNSMGGTLVWGVEATKNSDGIDCASSLDPISQIEKFQSEMTHLVSQAIMPRHEGIQIASVPSSATPGSGYLLIRVDRSERRPHRCEFGDKQYFKRIGDSSIAMEHYDIEDSFKRLVVPTLIPEIQLSRSQTRGGPEGTFYTLKISISLRNGSSVSARFPYLRITETHNIKVPPWNSHDSGVQFPGGIFNGGADHVIHPDQSIFAIYLPKEFRLNQKNELPRGSLNSPMIITFQYGSLHARASLHTAQFSEADVAKGLGIQLEPPLK